MNPKPLIVANWKMYKSIEESLAFVKQLHPFLVEDFSNDSSQQAEGQVFEFTKDIYLAAPFTALHPLKEEISHLLSPIKVGAQNMNDASEGAYTGEIAASMLVNAGAHFVILGHSERRQYFHEDNTFINKKVCRALSHDLELILCIGESLEQKKENKSISHLKEQLIECLQGVTLEKATKLNIAYEPLWAIGTGTPAKPEEVNELQGMIKEELSKLFSADISEKIRVLYGGSVKADNAPDYMRQAYIDGLLVGGASLSPQTFSNIINYDKETP